MVQLWRADLAKINPKAAESLADPEQYPNLFPNLDWALKAETAQVCGTPFFVLARLSQRVSACHFFKFPDL